MPIMCLIRWWVLCGNKRSLTCGPCPQRFLLIGEASEQGSIRCISEICCYNQVLSCVCLCGWAHTHSHHSLTLNCTQIISVRLELQASPPPLIFAWPTSITPASSVSETHFRKKGVTLYSEEGRTIHREQKGSPGCLWLPLQTGSSWNWDGADPGAPSLCEKCFTGHTTASLPCLHINCRAFCQRLDMKRERNSAKKKAWPAGRGIQAHGSARPCFVFTAEMAGGLGTGEGLRGNC